jgi:mono/diheme cytochrome c family protein
MRIPSIGIFALSLTAALACGGAQSSDTAPAPQPASPEPPPAEEVAPAAAADAASRGAALYGTHCARCHGDAGQGLKAPPVVGKEALPLDPRQGSKREAQFRTALDVFQYVRTNMPGDAPGSLQDDEYRAILAFDLKANGVDLTDKDTSDATLAAIVLH